MRELTNQDMALANGGVAPFVVIGAWVVVGTAVGWATQAYLSGETGAQPCLK